MNPFSYYNPTRLVFGRDAIAKLPELVPPGAKVLILYGKGSIKRNGVYDAVLAALQGYDLEEYGGVEPNPQHATLMGAVEKIAATGRDFVLAVGGGSVFDGCKYVCAAAKYEGDDPWDICLQAAPVTAALPWGGVLTLPATGSEMNGTSVISRDDHKLHFACDVVRPVFSVLDPATTFSLSERQTANGVVDAFVHVCEQYVTTPANVPLQDRQAEAVLLTLIEEGPKVMADPKDYDARANVMWCATNGLNGWLGLGAPGDWATHMIGHELTALYGVDHAQSLAIVQPGLWEHQFDRKRAKLAQMAERVWGVTEGDETAQAKAAIERTEAFYRSLGVGTRFGDYGIPAEACTLVAERIELRDMHLGEHGDIERREVEAILKLRV